MRSPADELLLDALQVDVATLRAERDDARADAAVVKELLHAALDQLAEANARDRHLCKQLALVTAAYRDLRAELAARRRHQQNREAAA